jgi:NAD(P)-dependent dehydrogenase (short-subunit alcohol dehydrogenase family)
MSEARTFVVIGGAGGIGAHSALSEAGRGHRGVIGDILPIDEIDPALQPHIDSGKVKYLQMNLLDADSLADFASKSVEFLGTKAPLALIITAGISKRGNMLKNEDFHGVELMQRLNVDGSLAGVEAFREALKKSQGTVVLASSIVAANGQSTQGDQFYMMTKLELWYHSARILHDADRFAGVSAWAVAPGAVVTQLTLREITFPAMMIPCAKLAANNEKLRATLASFVGASVESFPTTPAGIVYATHQDVLEGLENHDKIKAAFDKDPGLDRAGAVTFLGRAARGKDGPNPNVVNRSAEVLVAIDVAIKPEVVGEGISAQLDAGKPPKDAILEVYSVGPEKWIKKVGMG